MGMLSPCLVASILIMFPYADVLAGEPKRSEWIPIPQRPDAIVIPDIPRPGSRDFWQYYGVDSFGRFRPRVILSPYGAYDMRTGEPYPWITNSSPAFLPNVLGAPAGSIAAPPSIGNVPFAGPSPAPFMPYAVD